MREHKYIEAFDRKAGLSYRQTVSGGLLRIYVCMCIYIYIYIYIHVYHTTKKLKNKVLFTKIKFFHNEFASLVCSNTTIHAHYIGSIEKLEAFLKVDICIDKFINIIMDFL